MLAVGASAVLVAVVTLSGQRGAGPQPESTAQSPLVGRGTISGSVVDGTTGQPISGAVVTLGSVGRGSLPDPSRIATDAKGRFVLGRLPAGSYTLGATKHGYLNARYGQADPSNAASLRSIQIADGQWFAEARIVMWRPGAISGTVADESGEPAVGVMVRAIARITVAGRPQLASGALARTDDLGHYRIAALEPGSYVVFVPSVQASVPSELTLADLAGMTADGVKTAQAAGLNPVLADPPAIVVDVSNRLIVGNYVTPPPVSASAWSYPPTFFPSARSATDAEAVDLGRAEERTGVNIRLGPVRSVRISGVVQGPADATPARMTVRLLAAGNEGLGFGSETATALADVDGSFTLVNVPAGAYTIVVARTAMEYLTSPSSLYAAPLPPGCTGGSGGFVSLGSAPGGLGASYRNCRGDATFSARMPLTVSDRDMTGVVVPLIRGVSITGRLVYADAPPAADSVAARLGITVYAEPATGDALLGLPNSRSLPGDPTRFKIDGLLAGSYVVQVTGPSTGEVKSVEWQGRVYTDRPFDATTGNDIEDVVVTLTNQVTRVAGNVRTANGAAAPAATIVAFPTDRLLWTNYGLHPTHLRSTQLSTNGTYGLALPAGDYFVAAIDQSSAWDWRDPDHLKALSTQATRLTLNWGETKSLDLSVVSGKVSR